MKPSEETRRLKFIQTAAANVLAAHGEPFYRTLLIPGGPEGAGQWGTDLIALLVLSGMLVVVDDKNPAKRVFRAERQDIWEAIRDDVDVASWYVTQRITNVKKHGSPDVPPQFQPEMQSQVRLMEEQHEEHEEHEEHSADPMMAYIDRTVTVLENLDRRQLELLKEIKDQSDLVLGAVSRLDGVATREDVAGAAAELIGVVVKAAKQNDDLGIRIESLSAGMSALHTNVSAMQKNMETVLAHMGRTFADRLDAQREATGRRMAEMEKRMDAAVDRIEKARMPDVKPFEDLLDKMVSNMESFTKVKDISTVALREYSDHMEDSIKVAKSLVDLGVGLSKASGASKDEIAAALENIEPNGLAKSLTAVGLMPSENDKPAIIKTDAVHAERHTNRRVRRAMASVERK